MILTDEITCKVANPEAVKVELINCTTGLMESAKGMELFWSGLAALSALGALVVTILMARYAWKAWNTSRTQLELTREIALEQQRLPALSTFLMSMRSLAFVDFRTMTESDARILGRETSQHAEVWAISYKKIFKSGVLQNIVNAMSNDVTWCYRQRAIEQAESTVSGKTQKGWGSIWAIIDVNRLFRAVQETVYDLHQHQITEEEAMEALHSAYKQHIDNGGSRV